MVLKYRHQVVQKGVWNSDFTVRRWRCLWCCAGCKSAVWSHVPCAGPAPVLELTSTSPLVSSAHLTDTSPTRASKVQSSVRLQPPRWADSSLYHAHRPYNTDPLIRAPTTDVIFTDVRASQNGREGLRYLLICILSEVSRKDWERLNYWRPIDN